MKLLEYFILHQKTEKKPTVCVSFFVGHSKCENHSDKI